VIILGSKKARTSLAKFGKRIGKKVIPITHTAGTITLRKPRKATPPNGASGKNLSKVTTLQVKNGVKYTISNMTIGNVKQPNIQTIRKIVRILLMLFC
jgi:hypothetical protein